MKRIVFATAAIVLLISAAQAEEAKDLKDGQWRGQAGASAALSSGNTDARSFIANANVARQTADDKWSLYGNALSGYTKVAGVSVSSNRWLAGTQYDYNITPQLYGFGTFELSGDRSLDLTLRAALGGGLGYHVIATKETTFNVFGGLMYRHDKYKVAQLIGGNSVTTYGAPELIVGEESSHKLSDTISFQQKLVAYPNLKTHGQYRATFDAGLAIAMNKTLNLTVGVTDRYNSLVASGFKKNDFGLYTGISMKF